MKLTKVSSFGLCIPSLGRPCNRIRPATTLACALVLVLVLGASKVRAQKNDPVAEFKHEVAELSAGRLKGVDEDEAQQEKALAFLDSTALSLLNASAVPDLGAANQRLAALLPDDPAVGENFRLLKLGGTPPAYAMIVNFGLGGPAAVRLYAASAGRFALAARIDHFAQNDFLDSDVELVPASQNEPVFVTVSGRTDDLSTGAFSAWRFDGHRVVSLWTSDLLQQSNYQADAQGFHLTYCGKVDDDRPSQCLQMTRDLYRYEAGAWKRVDTANFPPPKPSSPKASPAK